MNFDLLATLEFCFGCSWCKTSM